MEKINLIIEEDNNLRLDKVIAMQLQELSRTQIQDMINQGLVLVNQKKEKASYKTKLNDEIEITILDNMHYYFIVKIFQESMVLTGRESFIELIRKQVVS